MLAQYEIIGPIISQKLYTDPHRKEVAEYYFENYIYDIVCDLQKGCKDYDNIARRYIEMANDMKRMYGINKEVKEEEVISLSEKIKNNQYKVKKLTKEQKVKFLFFSYL